MSNWRKDHLLVRAIEDQTNGYRFDYWTEGVTIIKTRTLMKASCNKTSIMLSNSSMLIFF